MKDEKTVIINGQRYDSVSGLPVSISKKRPDIISKKGIHSVAQRVNLRNITPEKKNAKGVILRSRKNGHSMDIARSSKVSRFNKVNSKENQQNNTVKSMNRMDIGPRKHHIAQKVEKKLIVSKKQSNNSSQLKSLKAIKEEAITEALNKPVVAKEKIGFFKRHHRTINVLSISLVLILIIGYFTYINIPGISVKIVSAQAGISATYPDYKPDGYSFDGPVVYNDGEVIINFKANSGAGKFTIKQVKSTWDSSAVKNMVNNDSNGEFITTEEHGLTIYTYNGNATWVNGGILYAISSEAHLSGDQIRRIAISL